MPPKVQKRKVNVLTLQVKAEIIVTNGDDPADPMPKLRELRAAADLILKYVDHPDSDKQMCRNQLHDELWRLRDLVIRSQNRRSYSQSRIDNFFRSPSPRNNSV